MWVGVGVGGFVCLNGWVSGSVGGCEWVARLWLHVGGKVGGCVGECVNGRVSG